MDGEGEDFENVEDRAKKLSELTGRDYEDVLTDLLDDGKLNQSNVDESPDLVEQLRGAAELIATVQNISKDIQDNSVLNGGENETVVEVKTTLEGDIVDRAIESVQRKAENLKKIGLTLIPIFLLLTGGTMETFGMIDIFGDDESNGYDDGCSPEWFYDDYSWGDDDTFYVSFSFFDETECGLELEGHFIVYIFREGEQSNFDAIHHNVGYFVNGVEVNLEIDSLENGDYWIQYEFHDIECEDGSCEHGDEWFSPHTPAFSIQIEDEIGCDAYLINEQAYLLEEDDENDAVKISADVALIQGERNCDSEQFEIIWRLYEYNNPSTIKYEHTTWESGVVSDPDGADYVHYTWDGVNEGSYEPKVVLRLNGDVLDEKQLAHTITIEAPPIYGCTDSEATNYDSMATDDDGSCEYPPDEPCEVEIQNHYRGHVAEDEEQDAILVAFKVAPTNCEGENIFVEIDLFQNGYAENYTYNATVMGDSTTDISHVFDGVAIGNSWIPRITATVEGEQKEQVMFWGIDVIEQEPDYCEINLYWIDIGTNATHASVGYDLDCGYDDNELDGYNVSVQFLVYEIGSANNSSAQPILYETRVHYIQGWVEDNNFITITNFTDSNNTHYDFYWYATWIDGDGESQMFEEKWLNRELNP